MMSGASKYALWVCIISIVLFAFSVVAHVLSIFGIPIVNDFTALFVTLSMILLGIPLVIVSVDLKQLDQKRLKMVYRKYAVGSFPMSFVIFLAYGIWVFIRMFMQSNTKSDDLPEAEGRCFAIYLFSAFWIFFFYIHASVSLVAYRFRKNPDIFN